MQYLKKFIVQPKKILSEQKFLPLEPLIRSGVVWFDDISNVFVVILYINDVIMGVGVYQKMN